MTIKRVTANLPADLLRDATSVTGRGITGTLIEGLELLRRKRAYSSFKALKGKINLEIDIDEARERRRR